MRYASYCQRPRHAIHKRRAQAVNMILGPSAFTRSQSSRVHTTCLPSAPAWSRRHAPSPSWRTRSRIDEPQSSPSMARELSNMAMSPLPIVGDPSSTAPIPLPPTPSSRRTANSRLSRRTMPTSQRCPPKQKSRLRSRLPWDYGRVSRPIPRPLLGRSCLLPPSSWKDTIRKLPLVMVLQMRTVPLLPLSTFSGFANIC
jgi:hypothetical protein